MHHIILSLLNTHRQVSSIKRMDDESLVAKVDDSRNLMMQMLVMVVQMLVMVVQMLVMVVQMQGSLSISKLEFFIRWYFQKMSFL